MSLGRRDTEALDLVRRRHFARTFLKSFDLEMQTRRLTVSLYGALDGTAANAVGTIAFFGAGELTLENEDGAFPDSVLVANASFSDYDDVSERGTATLSGDASWVLSWTYDGLAYEEYPATVASLVDES